MPDQTFKDAPLSAAEAKSVGYTDSPIDSEESAVSRFVAGAAKNLNPIGLVSAAVHPIDTAKALITAQTEQLAKAKKMYAEGRYSEAIGHLGAGVLPLVGPPAANAGERIGSGDVAGGLGEAAGLIASVEAPRVISATGKAVGPVAARTAQIARPLAASAAKPALVAGGAHLGGVPGAIIGATVGDELAARLRQSPRSIIEAPPTIQESMGLTSEEAMASRNATANAPEPIAPSSASPLPIGPMKITSAAELAEFNRMVKRGTPWREAVALITQQRELAQRMGLQSTGTVSDSVAARNTRGSW